MSWFKMQILPYATPEPFDSFFSVFFFPSTTPIYPPQIFYDHYNCIASHNFHIVVVIIVIVIVSGSDDAT